MKKNIILLTTLILLSSCAKPQQKIVNIKEKPLIIVHTSGNTGGIKAGAGRKVAKDFGINALYISDGCMVDMKLLDEIKKQNKKNEESYKYYDKELGKGWKKKFDSAVLKETIEMAKRSFQEAEEHQKSLKNK